MATSSPLGAYVRGIVNEVLVAFQPLYTSLTSMYATITASSTAATTAAATATAAANTATAALSQASALMLAISSATIDGGQLGNNTGSNGNSGNVSLDLDAGTF